jgi:hypothetical protein
MRGISWPAEWLLASQEVPCSMKLYYIKNVTAYLYENIVDTYERTATEIKVTIV